MLSKQNERQNKDNRLLLKDRKNKTILRPVPDNSEPVFYFQLKLSKQ